MPIDAQATLSRIVLDYPECAAVLQDRRLDFCCNGNATLAGACAARGLEVEPVIAALESAVTLRQGEPPVDPRSMTTAELVTYIVSRHHAYLRSALPYLAPLAAKVARVHGDHDPRLREIHEVFLVLLDTLDAHLEDEEANLFRQVTAPSQDTRRLAREMTAMLEEHRAIGGALHKIRELADDFTPPSWACTSYRTLLSELRTLEGDVQQHVHLENHVLLPRYAAAP